MPARIHLSKYDDVVNVIGGVGEVADLCGVSHSAVSEWRSKTGLFPAQHFFLISRELREWNCDVTDDLFDFTGHRHRPLTAPRPRWSEALRQSVLSRKKKP